MILKKIKEWRKRKKLLLDEKEREHQERYQEKYKESQKIINELEVKMTSRPCAINNFKNCSRDCVHFKPGFVMKLDGIFCIPPKCKLWVD